MIDRTPPPIHLIWSAAAAGIVVIWIVVTLLLVLQATSGHFNYDLDDPYIHLRVAEQIRHGSYGINPGEFAAPSSSLLWPFLLAGTPLPLEWLDIAPFLYSTIASACFAWWMGSAVSLVPASVVVRITLLVFSFLTVDPANLVICGLEHALQLVTSCAIVLTLWAACEEKRIPVWGWWALATAPLIRYECFALSAPAWVILASMGYRRGVSLSIVACLLPMAAFSIVAHHQTGFWLPTSVVAHSGLSLNAPTLGSLTSNLSMNLVFPNAKLMRDILLVLALLLYVAPSPRHQGGDVAILGSGMLYLAFGSFLYNHRYEAAEMGTLLLWGLLRLRHLPRSPVGRSAGRALALASIIALALPTQVAFKTIWGLPQAAKNVYDQQYQLGRFIREYWDKPIGVNDLGLMSYRGDRYILDFYGLACADALRARMSAHLTREWMPALATEHGVQAAVLYSHWFTASIPESWIEVGTLSLLDDPVMVGRGVVFYATTPQAAAELRQDLLRFAPTVTSHGRLDLTP